MVKLIPLTRGYSAIVDDEDCERLARFSWNALVATGGRIYAIRWVNRPRRHMLLLHREILGLPPGRYPEVDHVDHDGLNNQKRNLRAASRGQNVANSRKLRAHLSSRFKGVCLQKATGGWLASISIDKRQSHIGVYPTEEEAARAYDAAAHMAWGEFAYPNFPGEPIDLTLVPRDLGGTADRTRRWSEGEGWVNRTCETCGTIFLVERYRMRRPPAHWYCSPDCYHVTTRGERHGGAALTEDSVRSIRQEYAAGATLAALGRYYGVTAVNIGHIVKRKHWRHVA